MTAKEKAEELVNKFDYIIYTDQDHNNQVRKCAIIAVENEYYSLREMLFNLKACGVITHDRFYLYKIQKLIDEEQEIIKEIKKL
jgi:protein-tyrosine-phosphatase